MCVDKENAEIVQAFLEAFPIEKYPHVFLKEDLISQQ